MRHGEAVNNVLFILSSSPRLFPLTARGRRQVETSARALQAANISKIYSSPVRRARETADRVGIVLGVPLVIEDRLREIEFGTWFEVRPIFSYIHAFHSFKERFRLSKRGTETLRHVRDRMLHALHDIDNAHQDERILIVSHSDPLWLLKANLLGLNEKQAIKERHYLSLAKAEVQRVIDTGSSVRFETVARPKR